MSKLVNRLTAFARSPKGRAAVERLRTQAAKPENRRRIEHLAAKLKRGSGKPPGRSV